MKNTLIIILAILFILFGVWYVFKPVPKSENEIRLEAKSKVLEDSVKTLQSLYDLEGLKNKRLTAELVKHRAVVKRLEGSNNELLKRERYAKIENKRLIERYNNYQLDSAFMSMYPVPDSLHR